MNKASVDIEEENDAARFLVVELTKTPGGSMLITEEGFIGQMIEAMGLNLAHSTLQSTPGLKEP